MTDPTPTTDPDLATEPGPAADPDEGYAGLATLRLAEEELAVRVRVSGHFEPIDGRYHWSGAADGGRALVELVRAGHREASLRIPEAGEAPVRLGEPDPWSAVRLTGVGHPPWVPTDQPPADPLAGRALGQ